MSQGPEGQFLPPEPAPAPQPVAPVRRGPVDEEALEPEQRRAANEAGEEPAAGGDDEGEERERLPGPAAGDEPAQELPEEVEEDPAAEVAFDEVEEPSAVEPVEEEPAAEVDAAQELVVGEELEEEPAAVEPVAEEGAAAEPVEEEPGAVEAVAEEPAAVEPVEEEPAAVEPVGEEPASGGPVEEEPAAVATAEEEAAAAEPVEDEPAAVEPIAHAPVGAELEPPVPLDLGAWRPIAGLEAEPPERGGAEGAPVDAGDEPAKDAPEVADDDAAEEADVAAEAPEGLDAGEPDEDVAAEIDAEDEALAAEEEDAAAALVAELGAVDAWAPTAEDDTSSSEPGSARRTGPEAPIAVFPGVRAAPRAFEQASGPAFVERDEPPRSAAEVYQRSSAALERLTGMRAGAAWLEGEDIQYGSGRALESTFAETRDGGHRTDPQALELALAMAARGERVEDELVAEAATAAVSVLHEALRTLGASSGPRGGGDLFEDGATEAFIALHAEEWLAQLGFYEAFPGARADPELSGERLARTYTWQTVAARGYLERFALAAGRLPGAVVDDFVKGGGGAAGLNRLHLDYLRAQRAEGAEPDLEAEALAAQRMTADAFRLVGEIGGGLRDPASAGPIAAGIADQVMAGVAVPG